MIRFYFCSILFLFLFSIPVFSVEGNLLILNPYDRQNVQSLNGKWNVIIDPFAQGEVASFYQNRKPTKKTDIIEYTFNDAMQLDVPGDFNSQLTELKYYEGNVWYERTVKIDKSEGERNIIYFAGANYVTKVWLNGIFIGQHEGGFFPFGFDITSKAVNGINDLVVLTNNTRKPDNIPAMKYDWWNYGGITRDVMLIQVPNIYLQDYKIQLKRGTNNVIGGYVQLEGATSAQFVEVTIPELKVRKTFKTDSVGYASFEIKASPQLWEPDCPKLYEVAFKTEGDVVKEKIGFRTIEVKGTQVFLNGKPVFLKGVNFQEEISQRMGRAYSASDALSIMNEVKALGCNFVRTAHYPQNEYIIREAERLGIMIWEEIPVWQRIDFTDKIVCEKANTMLKEMIARDKNRAAIIIWSIANETFSSTYRDSTLKQLISLARETDDSRLISAAFNNPKFDEKTSTYSINDSIQQLLDVVGINIYMGWYYPFLLPPDKIRWNVAINKPLLVTEFGGESLFGKEGDADDASSWNENYQEKLYQENVIMFGNIPNLCGTAPWTLYDFRSPLRCHKQNQNGWNRKGLISDRGLRKKAWYVMKKYYEEK